MTESKESTTIYDHMFGEDRKNSIAVMGQNGDSVHMWDPDNSTEVEIAQSVWDKYKEKKYKAFQMDVSGDQGVQLDEFDPQVKAIIFVPQMVGG